MNQGLGDIDHEHRQIGAIIDWPCVDIHEVFESPVLFRVSKIYALQLAHVPPAFAGRLIVRIFPETQGSQRATAEGALQNALADAGYPVPRVVEVCTDATVLRGAFTLMHSVAGQT